jgi:hypothetical protein
MKRPVCSIVAIVIVQLSLQGLARAHDVTEYHNADGAIDLRFDVAALQRHGYSAPSHAGFVIEELGTLRIYARDGQVFAVDGALSAHGPAIEIAQADVKRRGRDRDAIRLSSVSISVVDGVLTHVVDPSAKQRLFSLHIAQLVLDPSMRAVTVMADLVVASGLMPRSGRQVAGSDVVGQAEIVIRLADATLLWSDGVATAGPGKRAASGTTCGNSGADVIVGSLSGTRSYGSIGDIHAFAIGTTSCNIGDQELLWHSSNNLHPLISQNMFRLNDDRFEHIGQAWLKHGFSALQQNACDCGCISSGVPFLLGVGCSDPYVSSLNGSQLGLGPKHEVNPHSGAFTYPFTHGDQGETGDAIYKRLQVHAADLDPLQDGGGLYFIEGHYTAADDAEAGNANNNASYRQVAVEGGMGSDYELDFIGMPSTQREQAAIRAWQDHDPDVVETDVQIPNDGLVVLAGKAVDMGGGQWRYEYALQNVNSDRSVSSFAVTLANDVVVQNIDFNDVDYHSGEPYDGTDWPGAYADGAVTWATTPFHIDANANALRWCTLYNYRFVSSAAPVSGYATIGLFKPGGTDEPVRMVVETVAPSGSFEPMCGNSVIEPGETCDPPAAEVCSTQCLLFPDCGNAAVEPGEECDPPMAEVCDDNCQFLPFCGNGEIDADEDCDPPNGITCDMDCQRIVMCGDDIVDEGEDCDPPDGETCNDECQFISPIIRRLFIAEDGAEADAPLEGHTSVVMAPGTSTSVAVWLQDEVQTMELGFYQVIIEWDAVPSEPTGVVSYLDNPGSGDSVLIDTAREDYVFNGLAANPPFYNETPPPPSGDAGFGFIGALVDLAEGASVVGIRYLGEFGLTAAEDACGTYVMSFVPFGDPPQGGTAFGSPGGLEPYPLELIQQLEIIVPCVPCEDPCDDGDPCTFDDACNGLLCQGEAVDCSALDDDCSLGACDFEGAAGNCDLAIPANDGLTCNSGVGTCNDGVCVPVDVTTRVFMAPFGQQGDVAFTGATHMTIPAGGSGAVGMWLQDNLQLQELNFYQVILRWQAESLGGAGVVQYLDDGVPPGGSVFTDIGRPDFVFEGQGVLPFYNETPPPPLASSGFGFLAGLNDVGAGISISGIRYLGQFELQASADASGMHELVFVELGQPPQGGTSLGTPGGASPFFIGEFQNLIVEVVEGENCPAGDVNWLTPADGIVDARQPHPVNSLTPLQGIDALVVDAPVGAAATCWTLCETDTVGVDPNSIIEVQEIGGGTYNLTLARPLTPGAVTTITYGGETTAQFIAHPGNVNADSFTSALDILALIDYINGVSAAPWGILSEDVNHSGQLTPTDILAVIDLLNGADTFEPWNGVGLPQNTICP